MSQNPTLIVFDCDGTISDSQHVICAAMAQAFEVNNLNPPSSEDIRSSIGLSVAQTMDHLLPEACDIDPMVIVNSFRQCYGVLVNNSDHTEILYEGAVETISALAQMPTVLLGIATGNSQRGVARVLRQFGEKHPFCTIQTADDAPSKPHPAMLQQAMAATGIDAACTIMVGDTSFDMEMAVNAGVYPLGVAWGYHRADRLESAGAKYIATDYADLDAHMRNVCLST